jgi:hypothetical protein
MKSRLQAPVLMVWTHIITPIKPGSLRWVKHTEGMEKKIFAWKPEAMRTGAGRPKLK